MNLNKKRMTLLLAGLLTLSSCADFMNSPPARRATPQSPSQNSPNKNGALPSEYQKPNEGRFSEGKMLANIGMNVIARQTREFLIEAQALESRVTRHCESLVTETNSNSSEQKLKSQWINTMLSYHKLDAAPLGPLNDAGRYLSDNIYSWPYLNVCGIDIEVVHLSATGDAREQILFSQRGLGALEYLIFDTQLSTACNQRAQPKTHQWAKKQTYEKKLDRCEYARFLTKDLVEKATELDKQWAMESGNYTRTLVDGSRYETLKDATNELTDSLFSLEKVKDQRLGKPLGRHKDCFNEAGKCPEAAEHPWSGIALEAISARLNGFKSVYFGSHNPQMKAFGIDDFLISVDSDHAQTNERILKNLETAQKAIDELLQKGTLQDQINEIDLEKCKLTTVEDRIIPLCALFQDIRQVSLAMKSEVLVILSLRTPPIFQGDND